MRIISKRPDYYDCIQKFAADDPNVYLRISRYENITPEESLRDLLISFWKSYLHSYTFSDKYLIRFVLVGFCGKVYPALRISYTEKFKDYVYDIEHMDKFIDGAHCKKVIKTYNTHSYRWSSKTSLRDDINAFFDKWHGSDKFEKLFWKFKTPIFTLSNTIEHHFRVSSYNKTITGDMSFKLNDVFKNYNFQKVFDPITSVY